MIYILYYIVSTVSSIYFSYSSVTFVSFGVPFSRNLLDSHLVWFNGSVCQTQRPAWRTIRHIWYGVWCMVLLMFVCNCCYFGLFKWCQSRARPNQSEPSWSTVAAAMWKVNAGNIFDMRVFCFIFFHFQTRETDLCVCFSISISIRLVRLCPSLCVVSGPTLWPVRRFDVSTIRILRVVIDANLTENTQRKWASVCVCVSVCGNCNRKEANLITSFSLFAF